MEDDLIDSIRYAMKTRRSKQMTNSHYGRSILSTTIGQKKAATLKGTTTEFTWVPKKTYDSPWDAEICRKWEGRAEEFWDARLQGRLFWEQAKNGSTRDD